MPLDRSIFYENLAKVEDGDMVKIPAGMKIFEGDITSNERGTCARSNGGKVRLSLFPMHLLVGATRVLEFGLKKYAAWNWAKGGPWSTAFDCTLRHLFKWWFCREELDEESGLHHLDHVICNILFLRHFHDTYKEGDDRPPAIATRFCDSLKAFKVSKVNVIETPASSKKINSRRKG